jgi:hypothetical protein
MPALLDLSLDQAQASRTASNSCAPEERADFVCSPSQKPTILRLLSEPLGGQLGVIHEWLSPRNGRTGPKPDIQSTAWPLRGSSSVSVIGVGPQPDAMPPTPDVVDQLSVVVNTGAHYGRFWVTKSCSGRLDCDCCSSRCRPDRAPVPPRQRGLSECRLVGSSAGRRLPLTDGRDDPIATVRRPTRWARSAISHTWNI